MKKLRDATKVEKKKGLNNIIKETFYDNLRWIEDGTNKKMLTQTDVAAFLGIDRKTVKRRYEKLFVDGLISAPVLARALTPK